MSYTLYKAKGDYTCILGEFANDPLHCIYDKNRRCSAKCVGFKIIKNSEGDMVQLNCCAQSFFVNTEKSL